MKLSSVSPERWLVMTPQPASLAMRTASIDSVTDPIWFTCAAPQAAREFAAPAASTHTACTLVPPRGRGRLCRPFSHTSGTPAACRPHAAH